MQSVGCGELDAISACIGFSPVCDAAIE